MNLTTFKPIGVGFASSHKELKSWELNISLANMASMADGDLVSAASKLEFSASTSTGAKAGSAEVKNYITATWLPMGSNRVFPPDIRRGESVTVYVTGDDGKYYWHENGLHDHYRRLETIVIAISNTNDESTTALTAENTYWIEFSTHSKKIGLFTSQSNDEPFAYEVVLDTDEGEFVCKDNQNTRIRLNSGEQRIEMANAMGSIASVVEDRIEATNSSGDTAWLEGGTISAVNISGSEVTMAGGDVLVKSSKGASIKMDGDLILENSAGSSLKLTGAQATLTAGGATVDLVGGIVMNN